VFLNRSSGRTGPRRSALACTSKRSPACNSSVSICVCPISLKRSQVGRKMSSQLRLRDPARPRNQQHIRRDGKEGTLGKGNGRQGLVIGSWFLSSLRISLRHRIREHPCGRAERPARCLRMLCFRWDTSFCADRAARRADDKLAATQSRRKVMQSSEELAPRKDAIGIEVVPRRPTAAPRRPSYLSA